MKHLGNGLWEVNIKGTVYTFNADDFNEALAKVWHMAKKL